MMTKFETAVRNQMNEAFDMEELRYLALDLGLDWDNIPGETKMRKIQEIITQMIRVHKTSELITTLRKNRPDSTWPDSSSESEMKYGKTDVELKEAIKIYLESLRQEVGYVRILGRNQREPLENIFTHVNVLEKVLADLRYNIDRLQTDFHPRDFSRYEQLERISGEEALEQFNKLFILGKPGTGKTTFLKHTAFRAIEREIDEIPIFINLKELSVSSKSILDFIIHQFEIHRFPNPDPFVRDLLKDGNAIVLFDGLDEVDFQDKNGSDLIRHLNDFIYQYGECLILMTCRVSAIDYSFTQFEYVEMADFDDEQIGRYIDQWFAKDETKRQICRQLLLEDDTYKSVRELAQVPLLLSLLCLVFEQLNTFPKKRDEIYEEAIRALLIDWDAKRNINRDTAYKKLSQKAKQRMLAYIADKTFEQGQYFFREQRITQLIESYLQGVEGLENAEGLVILKEIEAKHGIFVEIAHQIHSFSHLTLQEYFKARYIVINERRGEVQKLMDHVGDERWNEVFLLVAGMLNDATEFLILYLQAIQKMLTKDSQLVSIIEWVENKRRQTPMHYKSEAVRSFLLWYSLDLNQNLDFENTFDLDPDLALILDQALNLDKVVALDHDLAFDPNPNLTLERTTDRDRALDHALEFAFSFDLDHAFAFNPDIALDLACELDPDLKVSLKLTQDLSHVLIRSLDLDNEENRIVARNLSLQIAEFFSLTELKRGLETLSVDSDEKFWQRLNTLLEKVSPEWNPAQRMLVLKEELDERWILTNRQAQLLAQYLEANHVLVRCFEVAYVPNRQAIKSQMLLPPS